MSETGKSQATLTDIASLYKRKAGYVAVARAFVRENSLAEDIFHDSILYLLENLGRLHDENIQAYFSKILSSKCLDALRLRRRHDRGDEDMKSDLLENEMLAILSERAENGIVLRSDLIQRFNECKKKLPQLTVDLFMSSRISGLTHAELARKYGISVRRVNTEISSALKVFRAEFRDYLPIVLLLMFMQ